MDTFFKHLSYMALWNTLKQPHLSVGSTQDQDMPPSSIHHNHALRPIIAYLKVYRRPCIALSGFTQHLQPVGSCLCPNIPCVQNLHKTQVKKSHHVTPSHTEYPRPFHHKYQQSAPPVLDF